MAIEWTEEERNAVYNIARVLLVPIGSHYYDGEQFKQHARSMADVLYDIDCKVCLVLSGQPLT